MTTTPDTTADEAAAAKPDANALERGYWFAPFGYEGRPDEEVVLRDGLGTALVGDVWNVVLGLRKLKAEYNKLFHRLAYWAHGDSAPRDNDAILYLPEFGAIVTSSSAWAPGRQAIVAALLAWDDDKVEGRFTAGPLVSKKS